MPGFAVVSVAGWRLLGGEGSRGVGFGWSGPLLGSPTRGRGDRARGVCAV